MAEATYDTLIDPHDGLRRDGAFDEPGFANVLALRAEIESQRGGTPTPMACYVDPQWYQRAMLRTYARGPVMPVREAEAV